MTSTDPTSTHPIFYCECGLQCLGRIESKDYLLISRKRKELRKDFADIISKGCFRKEAHKIIAESEKCFLVVTK